MQTKIAHYHAFLFKIILKKKSSWILPIVTASLNLFLVIFLNLFPVNDQYYELIVYIFAFANLLLTIAFGAIKGLNLFKELETEGLDLLLLSKPISNKQFVLGKLLVFVGFGVGWTLVVFTTFLFLLLTIQKLNLVFALFALLAPFFSYLLFGLLTVLLSYKLNQKAAVLLPFLLATPLVISNTLVLANSTSVPNNLAFYLNAKYPLHRSGNEIDTQNFYLNNNQDEFLIVANGYQNTTLSFEQQTYLQTAYGFAQNASTTWWLLSWLNLPYQFVDVYNADNQNVLSIFSNNQNNHLQTYLYYQNSDSLNFSYELNDNPHLVKLPVNDFNGNPSQEYLVPGLLKNQNQLAFEIQNSDLIYARENADEFSVAFVEDQFQYSAINNLVGKLTWTNVEAVLQNAAFAEFAKTFFANLQTNPDLDPEKNPSDIKNGLLTAISKEINDANSPLFAIRDLNSHVLHPDAFSLRLLESPTAKQIYLATSLLYYLYFNHNDSYLLKALLFNEQFDNYEPSQIKIMVDDYVYYLGGYAQFTPKQQVQGDKVVLRYELMPSENYVFQKAAQVMAISRKNQVLNKNAYIAIWVGIVIILFVWAFYLYQKKDYR